MNDAGRQMPRWAAALVLITLAITFAAPAAANSHDGAGQYFEEAFLGEGESIDSPYELMFGVILPYLLVFAIIHYAMTSMWGDDSQKEATLIALVLAAFPIPTGAYQAIGDVLQRIADVISGEQLPETGFNGVPVLESIFTSSMPAYQQQAIVAVGTGALLAILIPFVGSKRESQELKKHEIAGIILLSAVVWMSMYTGTGNATANMLNVASFAGVLVLGAVMFWAALRHGEGIKSWIGAITGIAILGWALKKLPAGEESVFPAFIQQFGEGLLSGLMWIGVGLFFVIIVLVVVVAHLGG